MRSRLSRADSRRMRPDIEAAIEYLPGLASLALWCKFADTDEEIVACTDGSTIYVGTEYEKRASAERRFICLHEIFHIALCHPQRVRELKQREAGFNGLLLNIAADAIINASLENLTGLKTPSDAWTLGKIWDNLEKSDEANKSPSANGATASGALLTSAASVQLYGGAQKAKKIANLTRSEFVQVNRWSCEELYRFLKARCQTFAGFFEILAEGYGKDSLGRDLRDKHEGEKASASSRNRSCDLSETDESEEKRSWQQRLAILRGSHPEIFNRLASEMPKTETPWNRILRELVQTAFQEAAKTNYSRPSRRWLALERDFSARAGVSLPFEPDKMKKRGSRLAVALDTSGSIDDTLLGRFLAEIAVLCALNQRNLILIIGDAKVHKIAEIDWRDAASELKKVKYTGGGGTDFRPLIKAAVEYRPDALIYLTDLFGETGDAPDFPVIWATHGISGTSSWGEQIKLK